MDNGTLPATRADRAPGAAAVNLNLRQLSRPERIWLWRHRQRSTTGRVVGRGGARMSIGEAAAQLGVSSELYRRVENGQAPEYERMIADLLPSVGAAALTTAEQCQLARLRSGATVEELCAELGGISRPSFFAREEAGHPELVALWQARGFTL